MPLPAYDPKNDARPISQTFSVANSMDIASPVMPAITVNQSRRDIQFAVNITMRDSTNPPTRLAPRISPICGMDRPISAR